MYELLVQAGKETPVTGNAKGSYLTMKSNQGMVFGAATILSGTYEVLLTLGNFPNLVTGFSGIFCDQGYWQRVSTYRIFRAWYSTILGYRKRT